MLILPPRRTIQWEPMTDKMPGPTHRVRGEVRAVVLDLNRKPVFDTGWTPNLITDYGMYSLGCGGGIGGYMRLGTGTATPTVSDTALQTPTTALSEGAFSRISPQTPGAPDYQFGLQKKGRWDPGSFSGETISEMGLFASSANADANTNVQVRALLSPYVSVNADQYLDVYHRLWTYPILTEMPVPLSINGENFTVTTRAYYVSAGYYAESPYEKHTISGSSAGTMGHPGPGLEILWNPLTNSQPFSNSLGGDNTWPVGWNQTSVGGSSPTWWSEREIYLQLDHANFTYGIGGMTSIVGFHPMSGYAYKFQSLDTGLGVPKDETMRFRFRVRTNVERYP